VCDHINAPSTPPTRHAGRTADRTMTGPSESARCTATRSIRAGVQNRSRPAAAADALHTEGCLKIYEDVATGGSRSQAPRRHRSSASVGRMWSPSATSTAGASPPATSTAGASPGAERSGRWAAAGLRRR